MKPKLLLAADTYYPMVDGTRIFMEHFIKRAGKYFDISLLVPELSKKKDERVIDTIFIQPSKYISLSGYPNMKFSWKNFKKIKSTVSKAEIVFCQGPALMSYLTAFYAHRLNKITFFYTHTLSWELVEKHFPPLLRRISYNLVKRMSVYFYNLCDEIFVPYQELKDQLRKSGIKAKMSVARLGVDINVFKPAADKRHWKRKIGLDPDKTVIGYVGRISKEKNIQVLLEAFEKLEPGFQLLLVGDGPQSQKNLISKNIKVTGFVNNVPDYLKAMDIFVMPSLTETTSLATLEAMSCGLPVIATKVGFMKKYIVKEHNGLFFPRNQSTVLALKLTKLAASQELREQLGKNARRTVAYSFSWERSINKIARLILKRHHP